MGSPAKVIFVSANPRQYSQLQSNEELRGIGEGIRKADRSRLQLQHMPAARPADLLQVLHESPAILHFSGHGAGEQGLCFQSDNGSAEYVTSAQLAGVLRATRHAVKLVFLNACYSEAQALDLLQHVPCVVGIFGAIGDDAAIVYAREFYLAVADDQSVAQAHQRGVVALALRPTRATPRDVALSERAGPSGPRLLTRAGVDADSLYVTNRRHMRRTPAGIASRFLAFGIAVSVAVLIAYHLEMRASLRTNASDSRVAVTGPAPASAPSNTSSTRVSPLAPTEKPQAQLDPATSARASDSRDSSTRPRRSHAGAHTRIPEAPSPTVNQMPMSSPPAQDPKPESGGAEPESAEPTLDEVRSKDNDQLQRRRANGGE